MAVLGADVVGEAVRVVVDVDLVVERVVVADLDGVGDGERAGGGRRQRVAASGHGIRGQVAQARATVVVAGVDDRVEDQVGRIGAARVGDRVGVGDLVTLLAQGVARLRHRDRRLEQLDLVVVGVAERGSGEVRGLVVPDGHGVDERVGVTGQDRARRGDRAKSTGCERGAAGVPRNVRVALVNAV